MISFPLNSRPHPIKFALQCSGGPTGSITLNVWRIKLSQEGSPLVIWINLGRCLGWLNQPEQPIRDPLRTIGDLVHGCVAQPITEVSGYDSIPTKHGVVIPDTFQP